MFLVYIALITQGKQYPLLNIIAKLVKATLWVEEIKNK